MNAQQQGARLRPFRPVPFGRYTLLTPLSMGGMGEIFLARLDGAQGFEKLCVIKKILPAFAQDAEFVERFLNEARVLVKLSHGSIAQVLDVALFEGDPYIALEYVDGKDLRRVAARARDHGSPLPLTFALYVAARVLDALAYAHRKRDDEGRELQLVHRDISPQNILISYEGEVKVIDFGLAKSSLSAARTHPSMILGKLLYMSPEQARHQKVDRRTDLYAVGVCLYELISGQHPFSDVAPGDILIRVADPVITPLQRLVPELPRSVEALVSRALEVDPAKRFQSAEEFRAAVQACLVEIDSGAGPESVSRQMLEAFSTEYQQERRLLASLRTTVRPAEDEAAGTRLTTEIETAVVALEAVAPSREAARTFLEMEAPAKNSGPSLAPEAPIQPVPLSFAPTPRLREGAEPRPYDGETVPGVVVDPSLCEIPGEEPPAAGARSLHLAAIVAVALVVCAMAWTAWSLLSDAQPPIPSARPTRDPAQSPPPPPQAEAPRPVAAPPPQPQPQPLPEAADQESAEQLLTPLSPSAARQLKGLRAEWTRIRASFSKLKRRNGCKVAGMQGVCGQAQKLEADLRQVDAGDEARIAQLRQALEAFRRDVAEISRKGVQR